MAVVGAFIGGMFSFGAGAAFTAGAATFGAWTAGAAFASTVIGSLTVKLLSTVAISALTSALTPEPAQGGGITITATLRGEQNPETIILGRYATAGQAIAAPYVHGRGNSGLTHVVELCSLPGAKLRRVMIGDAWMPLGETPHPEYGYPVLGDSDVSGRIWVKYHDGSQTVADPYLRTRYGSHPDRPWSADMVGNGLCYAILTFAFHRERLTSVPRYRFEMDGIPLYDIRRDSTAGGSGPQRLNNPATWESSDNPVVMIWNIMRGIPLPGGEVYGGGISDLSELPQAMWVTAMNRCDAPIAIAGGGSEPQYRAGLEIALNQPPAAALEELLKACSATVTDLGHGWGIVVGAPALPVMSFDDDDIIVSKPQDMDPFPGLEATWNAVSARYPDPAELYETKEAPQRTNATWEAADAFGRRMANLSLPAVPYGRQVQRLMRAWIEDERRFRRHNLSLPPDAAHVEPGDTVSWTSARNGYAAKTFSVHKIVEDPRTGIRALSLRERNAEDYSWDPGHELPSTPTAPGTTPSAPEAVAGFAVAPLTMTDAGGIPRRAGIGMSWDSDVVGRGLQWQLRLAGQSAVELSGATVDVEAGGLRLFDGILPATDYQARAQLISSRRNAWTPWLPVATPNVRLTSEDLDNTPPPVPTGLVMTSTPTVLSADWDASPAADLAHYDIELTEGAGNPIAFQTPHNRHRWQLAVPGGSFTVRVRACDRLGNRSAWSAPVSHIAAGDTVPPAMPAGLTVTAAFKGFWLEWTPNADADLSHYELIWRPTYWTPAAGVAADLSTPSAKVALGGLGDAVTRWFRLRAVDTSGNRSAWTDAVSATTLAEIDTTVTNAELAGLIDATSFASGIEPVSVIASGPLPTVKTTTAIVWGGKLYRWDGSAYSASAATSDLTGQIVSAQIATGAVKAEQIDAGAITASKLAIGDFTNLVPDSEVIDPAAWTLQAGITFDATSKSITFPGGWTGARSANSARFPVEAGAEYFFSATISTTDAAAVGNFRLQLRWLNAAGGWISWTPNADEAIPQNGEKLIERAYAAPAGAVAGVFYGHALNGTSAAVTMTKPVVRRKGEGKLLVDGSLKARHMAAEEIISLSAQIKSAVISDAHITDLSAAKLAAGTALANSITVDGTALSAVRNNAATGAQDPGTRINQGTTKIDPGKITISGPTTLLDWRGIADKTTINGGVIETGSITTGSLRVGVTPNLVVNGSFDDTSSPPTRFWTGNNCALSWSGTFRGSPCLHAARSAAGQFSCQSLPEHSIGVQPGETLSGEAYAYASAAVTGAFFFRAVWLNSAGAESGFTDFVAGAELVTTWRRFTGTVQVPIGADIVAVRIRVYCTQDTANWMRLGSLRVQRQSLGVDIADGEVTAAKVDVTSFNASGLAVFGGTLQSDDFSLANGTSWRIQKAGTMNMPNAVVGTLELAGNAVSVPASASATTEIVLNDATEKTLLSVTINRKGAPTLVWASVQMGAYGSQAIASFKLYRGSTLLETFPAVSGWNGVQTALAFSWRDTNTGTGSTTYYLKAVRAEESPYAGNPQIKNRTLMVLHVMR